MNKPNADIATHTSTSCHWDVLNSRTQAHQHDQGNTRRRSGPAQPHRVHRLGASPRPPGPVAVAQRNVAAQGHAVRSRRTAGAAKGPPSTEKGQTLTATRPGRDTWQWPCWACPVQHASTRRYLPSLHFLRPASSAAAAADPEDFLFFFTGIVLPRGGARPAAGARSRGPSGLTAPGRRRLPKPTMTRL